MLQRSIVLFGCLVSSGTIALASPAIAQPPTPVVRANGFTKQVPSCYIETTGGGFQNLDANCLMGKVPDPEMFDMVTDRDGDGVPDDLVPLFKQMNVAMRDPSGTVQGKGLQQSFQTIANRAPVTATTRQNLRELANILGSMSRITPDNPPVGQQYQRLMRVSEQLNQDPIMRQITEYNQRYLANHASDH